MQRRLLAFREFTGAFQYDIDLELLVREGGGILGCGRPDLPEFCSEHAVLVTRAAAIEAAVGRIKLEQVRQRFAVGEVVDQDDIDVLVVAEDDPERLSADATESVDGEVHTTGILEYWSIGILGGFRGLPYSL